MFQCPIIGYLDSLSHFSDHTHTTQSRHYSYNFESEASNNKTMNRQHDDNILRMSDTSLLESKNDHQDKDEFLSSSDQQQHHDQEMMIKNISTLHALDEALQNQLQQSEGGIKLPFTNQEFQKDGSGISQVDDGIFIIPTPCFVIKTFASPVIKSISNSSTQKIKFFVNVCHDPSITPPKQTKKLDETTGKEMEGLNVPISVGPIRICKDVSSVECRALDCIVNPDSLEDDRDFLCQLIIQYVQQKFHKEYRDFDRRYKIPRMKYKAYVDSRTGLILEKKSEFAQVCKQRVRKIVSPQIEEIENKKEKIKNKVTGNKKNLSSSYTCSIEPFVQDTSTKLIPIKDFLKAVEKQVMKQSFHDRTLKNSESILRPQNNYLPFLCDIPKTVTLLEDSSLISPYQIILKCKLSSGSTSQNILKKEDIQVDISTTMCTISLGVSKQAQKEYYFPFPVNSKQGSCQYESISKVLTVIIPFLDSTLSGSSIETNPDIGSDSWNLIHGISDSKKKSKKCGDENIAVQKVQVQEQQESNNNNDVEVLDPLWFYGLSDTPSFTNLTSTSNDNSINENKETSSKKALPEDHFHKNDFLSQFIMQEQEKERQERIENFEKEKDPDIVEYVDVQPSLKKEDSQQGQESNENLEDMIDLFVKCSDNDRQGSDVEFLLSNRYWSSLVK